MVTVIKPQKSPLQQIIEPFADIAEKRIEAREKSRLQQELQEAQNQAVTQYISSESFQTAPLSERMSLLSGKFGPEIASAYGKGEELRIKGEELEFKKTQEKGTKDAISLPQQLDQASKRYKARIDKIKLPFEKSDAFGNIFLDFEQDEKKRKTVLEQLDKELDRLEKEQARQYQKAGVEVPEDLREQILADTGLSETTFDLDGKKITLEDYQQIQKVSNTLKEKYPPSEHKGKRKRHKGTGLLFESDGERWFLAEEE